MQLMTNVEWQERAAGNDRIVMSISRLGLRFK